MITSLSPPALRRSQWAISTLLRFSIQEQFSTSTRGALPVRLSPLATTDSSGLCVTGSVLESASTYCWSEFRLLLVSRRRRRCSWRVMAQAGEPITVVDPGLFVNIEAKKVDEASIGQGSPGQSWTSTG